MQLVATEGFKTGITWTKNVLKILALAIAWEQKQEKKTECTAVTQVRENGGLT